MSNSRFESIRNWITPVSVWLFFVVLLADNAMHGEQRRARAAADLAARTTQIQSVVGKKVTEVSGVQSPITIVFEDGTILTFESHKVRMVTPELQQVELGDW